MFRGQRAALLVDPLLVEDFGHAQALEYRVFPPRVWTPDAMPKLDAVILSHEHDDHFDIQITLADGTRSNRMCQPAEMS